MPNLELAADVSTVFNRSLVVSCSALLISLAGNVQAEELRLTAAELFTRSSTQNVQLSADGKSIELTRGLLIENDGDAAGFSYKPNEEDLSKVASAVQVLDLKLPRQRVFLNHGISEPLLPPKAYLLVGHNGKQLAATINGQPVELAEPKKAGNYWKQFAIPPSVLKSGVNQIALSGDGKLWIARRDERGPVDRQRLARSQQSFKFNKQEPTQKTRMLGTNNDIEGEYYVRLYLDGFMQEEPTFATSLRLPLLDAANLAGKNISPRRVKVKRISISLDGDWPEGGGPTIFVNSPQVAPYREVDAFNSVGSGGSPVLNLVDKRLPRFFDIQIRLPSVDPGKSSRLRSVQIITEIDEIDSWSSKVKVLAHSDSPALSPNGSFDYEKLDHRRLIEFRQQYALDDVVKGCTTDLQRMEKLAVWTSQQWTKGHLKDIYPKWDALEILKKHEDDTPIGGFCQQFNIVFLQACESFGMVGRAVSIGAGDHGVNIRSGHEVVEIWSNELNKWVYVDGQAAWYFVDKETRAPLNLLELRARQIATLRDQPTQEVEAVVLAKSPYEWKGLREWPAFTELRMIPHTQFLDGKLPLPLNQGMRGWFWTGHRVWTDELMPASILYSDRVTNVNDWNFAVNQTQFWLEQKEKPGELSMRLTHNMPSFANYIVQIAGEKERMTAAQELDWKLRSGENRLQVQAVNKLGIKGPPSWIELQYTP